MKIAVFGLGYVGVTATCCMAKSGHSVVGFDVNREKVEAVSRGISPIVEPQIAELLSDAVRSGLVTAFTAIDEHLEDCELAVVCVGTPSAPDGSHDMSYIIAVTRQIAAAAKRHETKLTVVYRSTFRPGIMEELIGPTFQAELGSEWESKVELVYNPEFLRESSAVSDYFAPPRIVIGTADGRGSARMDALYQEIDAPRFNVRFGEAEITKLVDNSWHAIKVAYANEIGRLCLQLGLSASKVHEIFVSDTKLNISPYYTRPGGAFGGSCLPKDVRALQYVAADAGAMVPVVDALIRSNEAHKYRLYQLATDGLAPGDRVLLAGLAFKAGTDDLRESPNVDLARALLRDGYRLSVYDPAVDTDKLVGANLGYAHLQLPTLSSLLVSREIAEAGPYDRVIVSNGTGRQLTLPTGQDVINLGTLA